VVFAEVPDAVLEDLPQQPGRAGPVARLRDEPGMCVPALRVEG
jgi:hypothetical protein